MTQASSSTALPLRSGADDHEPAFFQELLERTDAARRQFETAEAVLEIVAHGMELSRYRHFLMELHAVVWHFNPVCAAAVSRMGPGRAWLREFLYRHMHEEAGHDDWVLQDLEAVGGRSIDVGRHLPSVPTRCLMAFNHWQADRGEPCGVLGMLYALEVIASVYASPFAAALRERLFLDGDHGVSFLVSHASLDTAHLAELRAVIDRLRDPLAQDAVVQSAEVNFAQFTRLIEVLP